ncbi:MAG: hypothetical protein Q4C70_06310 [Planctomycetia bacterium]|nr:hypothetical protein [Planctomycetia bacterium]
MKNIISLTLLPIFWGLFILSSEAVGQVKITEIPPTSPLYEFTDVATEGGGRNGMVNLSKDGKHSLFRVTTNNDSLWTTLWGNRWREVLIFDAKTRVDTQHSWGYEWSSTGESVAYCHKEKGKNQLFVNHQLIKTFEKKWSIRDIWFEKTENGEKVNVHLSRDENMWPCAQWVDGELHEFRKDIQEYYYRTFPKCGNAKIETLPDGRQKLTVGDREILCDGVKTCENYQNPRKMAFHTMTEGISTIFEYDDGNVYEYDARNFDVYGNVLTYFGNVLGYTSGMNDFVFHLMQAGRKKEIHVPFNTIYGLNNALQFTTLDTGIVVARNTSENEKNDESNEEKIWYACVYRDGKCVRQEPIKDNSFYSVVFYYNAERDELCYTRWPEKEVMEIVTSHGKKIIQSFKWIELLPSRAETDYENSFVYAYETPDGCYVHCPDGEELGPFASMIDFYREPQGDGWLTIVQEHDTQKYRMILNGHLEPETFDIVYPIIKLYIPERFHTYGMKDEKWYKIEVEF